MYDYRTFYMTTALAQSKATHFLLEQLVDFFWRNDFIQNRAINCIIMVDILVSGKLATWKHIFYVGLWFAECRYVIEGLIAGLIC